MKKKTKNASMDVTDTERFLYKINLVKQKKKMKNIKMNAIYVKIFLRKKTKGVNMYTKKKAHNFF